MITIDQLLESVDLNFEPRWVTSTKDKCVCIWEREPSQIGYYWDAPGGYSAFSGLKLAEFDGKDWRECIYEVPRKVDPYAEYKKWIGKLCHFGFVDEGDAGYMILEKFNDTSMLCSNRFIASDNIGYRFCEPVRPDDDVIYKDAVNELKGAKNE